MRSVSAKHDRSGPSIRRASKGVTDMSFIAVFKSGHRFRVVRRAHSRTYCILFSLLLAAGAHAQTCLAPANNDWTTWLQAQENAGGHAMQCHLNVTVNGLIGR